MKNSTIAFLIMAALAIPARAEFLQMEISIFGMD